MQTQEEETVIISQKQAHAFAVAVFDDIRAYREAHQAEFEEFLKAEQNRETERIIHIIRKSIGSRFVRLSDY